MSFVLYSKLFDSLISILVIFNIIMTVIISVDDLKKDLSKNNDGNKFNKLEMFKIVTTLLYLLLISLFIVHLADKYHITSYFTLIYYAVVALLSIKIYKKNINDLTSENKMSHIQTTILFLIFFSSKASSIYINTPLDISHTIKEFLLLFFLSIKIIFFIYCLIINFSIFISNIYILFNKPLKAIKKGINWFIDNIFEFNLYNFNLSNKYSKKYLILDIIIFIITCPFLLIINGILALIILILKFIFKNILKLSNIILKYFDNSTKIITKTLKVSIIISLLLIYILAVYNPNIIFNTTKEVYNLLITVILIPLIYDSIKSKS